MLELKLTDVIKGVPGSKDKQKQGWFVFYPVLRIGSISGDWELSALKGKR